MKGAINAVLMLGALSCGACASLGAQPEPVGTTGSTQRTPVEVESSRQGVLPVGLQIDVRLQEALSSATAKAEHACEKPGATYI